MSITNTNTRNDYVGNGSVSTYSYTFKIFLEQDLTVIKKDATTNVETSLILNTHYTVTGVGLTAGGSITLITGNLANQDTLSILRVEPLTQLTEFRNQSEYFASLHENAFDKMTMITQQQKEELNRSVKLPVSAASVSTTLPIPTANNVIGWNATATALQNITNLNIAASQNTRVDTYVNGVDYTAGTTLTLTLSALPGAEENTTVFFDGVYQPVSRYSVSGAVITFSPAITVGVAKVEIKYLYTTNVGITASENVTHISSGAGSVSTDVRARLRETISVKDFGAVGDGVVNDTAAINLCLAAAGGKRVFFPKGTYSVNNSGVAYSGINYALKFSAADVLIEGEGDQSFIKLLTHEQFTGIINVQDATGKVTIQNIKIGSAARVNTTHNGPMAIDFGEFGNTANSGSLTDLLVQNVMFENVGFFVHGEGSTNIRILNNRGNVQGGGVYPSYFSEWVNIGSNALATFRTKYLEISGNVVASDGTYDDHAIYTLGPIDTIVIERNHHSISSTNGLYKIDFGTGNPTFFNFTINNNFVSDSTSAEGFITFSGTGIVHNCNIAGNRVGVCGRFIDSDALHFRQMLVTGNYARSSTSRCISMVKNSTLSVIGVGTFSFNDFRSYNTLVDGGIGLSLECFNVINVFGNDLTAAGSGSGSPVNLSNQTWGSVFGNQSDKTPTYLTGGNTTKLNDFGNSWDTAQFYCDSVPNLQPHIRGEIAWLRSPSNGDPVFYICTVSGTPGTWVSGPIIGTSVTTITPNTNVSSSINEGFGAGVIRTLAISGTSFIHFTGATAIDLQGMAAGNFGQRLVINNATGENMTVRHNSANPAAANRIFTMTGADVVSTGNCACELIYDSAELRWILLYMTT